MHNNKIALYVHWPFCLSKCPYCDFNSHKAKNIDENAWEQALLKDLNKNLQEFGQGFEISSIFFGGGTPSLMQSQTVNKIIEATTKHGLCKNAEISLEANPRTINKTKLIDFKKAGVNRISLGVQSFLDKNLEFLQRDHKAEHNYKTICDIKEIFENFSFDLIYGLKNQTLQDLNQELAKIKELQPKHVSAYQLTIEKNTVFYNKNIKEATDTLSIAMHSIIKDFLKTQGLLQYEVSNYAKKGYECKHNLSYWNGTPYVGIGAGACGRVVKNGNWFESRAIKTPSKYLNAVLTNQSSFEVFNKIDDTSRFEEIFLSYIRLNDGIPPKIVQKLSKKQGQKTKELIENGFLTLKNNNLTCTKKGMFYINSIVEFIFT